MNSNITQSKRRPGWVWAISIFFFSSVAYALVSFYLVYSGKVPLRPEQKAYLDSLTITDYSLTILIGLANLIGAGLLFFLRKQAFIFFAVSFVINLMMTSWHIANKGVLAATSSSGLFGILIGLGILVAICVYVKKLEKLGILN